MKKKSILWLFAALLLTTIVIAVCNAQNNGDTGTLTTSQSVTYVGTGTGPYISSVCPPLKPCQAIFNNVGQSAHYLKYCATGNFIGTVDIEESYDGVTNWTPIAFASYISGNALAGCGILQAGGPYQNIRSVVNNVSSGSLTAEYNASTGPISFAPTGMTNSGATAPTVCNSEPSSGTVASSATVPLVLNPAPGTRVRVCSYEISFSGATTTGNYSFGFTAGSCTSPAQILEMYTTASTPQTLMQGSGVGELLSVPVAGDSLCFTNNSGVSLFLHYYYTIY